jgi:hypothetical protein
MPDKLVVGRKKSKHDMLRLMCVEAPPTHTAETRDKMQRKRKKTNANNFRAQIILYHVGTSKLEVWECLGREQVKDHARASQPRYFYCRALAI